MSAYHRTDETVFLTQKEAIDIWNNSSFLNVNKTYQEELNDSANKLYMLRSEKLY